MDTEIPLQFQQQPPIHLGDQQQPHHQPVLLQNELAVVRRAGREAVRSFLESHNCFAVLKTSAKVVVFDTRIPIQLAFYALVEHGKQ
jgi:5'-AMP-activated protein kinase, regulatory gamma subunit